jgi:hypothetical protein
LKKTKNRYKEENASFRITAHTAAHLQQFSVPKSGMVEIQYICASTFFEQEVTQADCVFVSSEKPLLFRRSANYSGYKTN